MIKPSPAILVRADTPLADCVQLMKENNSGSILVVGDDAQASLVGIFTERDLVKHINLIQQGGYWSRLIRTVMTTPVITVEASKLEMAPKILMDHNIRQVPVIDTTPNGHKKVIGLVTLKDLILDTHSGKHEEQTEEESEENSPTLKGQGKFKCSVVSQDRFFTRLTTNFVANLLGIKIRQVSPKDAVIAKLDILFLDIDGFENETWPVYLKEVIKNSNINSIILSFNPSQHSPETVATLQKLGKSSKFWIFKKPMEVYQLISQLPKLLYSAHLNDTKDQG